MDWKKFAKGETTNKKETAMPSDSEKKVTLREINEYEHNKKQQRKDPDGLKKTKSKMERQGFSNPSHASKRAYDTLRIGTTFDKFVNTSALLTTLDISKQTAFNYYNNQLQHNMLLASQNDELIKQNDKIIEQNDEMIKLLTQISNK